MQKQTTDQSTEQIYEQTEKVVADLKTKWDKTEEKPAAIGLTVAAFVALYVANGVVNALDNIPVISGVLELVGIFVTSWFVYRYLVFGPGAPTAAPHFVSFWHAASISFPSSPTEAHTACFKLKRTLERRVVTPPTRSVHTSGSVCD